MKIGILGYGKMGRAIEALALQRGHEIGVCIDNPQQWAEREEALATCDVAVDFSQPDSAVDNIRRCFALNVPVVVGTTGWHDQLPTLISQCQAGNHALFVASNFSVGMNIMFALNQRLAELMNAHPEYEVSLTETHHIHKLDAPSGTASTLANDAIARLDRKQRWALDSPDADTLSIHAIRQGEVPGTHTLSYHCPHDTITLSHEAHSRQGFVLGAVLACEYMVGKRGFHTMSHLLGQ